jgi:hypothetical protein
MVPVNVTVGGALVPTRSYSFEVIGARAFAPLFAGLATGGAISKAVRSAGPATVWLNVKLDTGEETVEFSDVVQTGQPSTSTAGELSLLLSVITDNSFVRRSLKNVEVDVRVDSDRMWTVIDRVDADKSVYRPGDMVGLRIRLRPRRGESYEREMSLRLPESVPDGELILRVGGAASYHAWESDRLGAGLVPRTYEQLLDLVRRSKPGDMVIAEVLSDVPGFSLLGDEIREAPGKAGLVMAGSATSGAFDRSKQSLLAADEFKVDGQVSGFHQLKLRVKKGS